MANNYYNFPVAFIPGTKVRSEQVNVQYQGIESAFDLLPTDPTAMSTGKGWFGTEVQGATVNDFLVTTPDPQAALTNGQRVAFFATHSNTGAATINVDTLGVVNLVSNDGSALGANDVVLGQYYEVVYDNTNTQFLLSLAAGNTSTFPQITATSNAAIDLVDTNVALRVGAVNPITAQHLEFDSGSIQSKSNATTAAGLSLNALGGNVSFGGNAILSNTLSLQWGAATTRITASSVTNTLDFFTASVIGLQLSSIGQVNIPVGDLVFTEKANHTVVAPAAGFGYLWVRDDSPTSLIFTDDTGVDINLGIVGGAPGGADTNVQFNNVGAFGGSANFTFDGTNVVIAGNINTLGIDENATSERVQIDDTQILLGDTGATFYLISRAANNGGVQISGGNADATGTNIILYGGLHATAAGDYLVRSGAVFLQQYDASANQWDFYQAGVRTFRIQPTFMEMGPTTLGTDYEINRGIDNAILSISGGSNVGSGANIRLHGSSATNALDVHFRANSTDWMFWDNSATLLTLTGILDVTGAITSGSAAADGAVDIDGLAAGQPVLRFNQAGSLRAFLQWSNAGTDLLINSSGNIHLRNVNVSVAQTLTAAAGGLEVNNTLTGGGFERVLTTSDIGGNVSSTGVPVNNQVAVWTNATTIEGDAALSFDTANDVLTVGNGGSANAEIAINASAAGNPNLQWNQNGTVRAFLNYANAGALFTINADGDIRILPTNVLMTQFINGSGMQHVGGIRLTERAASGFTPAATFGEIWLENTVLQALTFTDDSGEDHGLHSRLETEVVAASQTAINFTGIPSWVKKITVMFAGLSTNGTSLPVLRLGDSGGIETSGYLGSASAISTAVLTANHSSGFQFDTVNAAAFIIHGALTLTLQDSTNNVWVVSGNLGHSETTRSKNIAGSKPLSATLDRVQITMVNGTDTFDAGAVNILYE